MKKNICNLCNLVNSVSQFVLICLPLRNRMLHIIWQRCHAFECTMKKVNIFFVSLIFEVRESSFALNITLASDSLSVIVCIKDPWCGFSFLRPNVLDFILWSSSCIALSKNWNRKKMSIFLKSFHFHENLVLKLCNF